MKRMLSGSTSAVPLANADTRQVSACHCEERSGGTIRALAEEGQIKQYFGRIREWYAPFRANSEKDTERKEGGILYVKGREGSKRGQERSGKAV